MKMCLIMVTTYKAYKVRYRKLQSAIRPTEDSYVICSKYNMNTGRWELIDNGTGTLNNSQVAEPSMIELDGYIYVIGGNDYESCKSINKCDIANNCWVDCCDLKTGVVEFSLVVMDKKVLILDPKSYEVLTEHSVRSCKK